MISLSLLTLAYPLEFNTGDIPEEVEEEVQPEEDM